MASARRSSQDSSLRTPPSGLRASGSSTTHPPSSNGASGIPIRFVLDLRKPPPPPPPMTERESESERCERLENEVRALRESQKALLTQVNSLTRQLQAAGSPGTGKVPHGSSTKTSAATNGVEPLLEELEHTKKQLGKLKEEHKVALELIVALGATLAHMPPGSSATNTKPLGTPSKNGATAPKGSENRHPPFVVPGEKGETFNARALFGGDRRTNPSPSRPSKRSPGRRDSVE